jgi:alkanesulfonate monooxygenase SsuD/methylene tetrahydromethanopterin reductase-like flavin-dependent oxidoreductase (luciferase family)
MCTMSELRRLWQTAEELGFDWISVWDHFYSNPGGLDGPCFEAVACHAALAATTSRVRVGSLVYSSGYRHPAVLAKAAVTIDHLSNGRLELGIGAGWHKAEYEGYGIPFEPPAVRLRRLAEYVEIVRALWTSDVVNYKGEFYTLTDAYGAPKPVQESPRIWVGATGPRALQLAGRLGDAWNTSAVSPEEFTRRFDIVRSAAADPERLLTGVNFMYLDIPQGKFDEEIRRRCMDPDSPGLKDYLLLANDLDTLGERISAYAQAGVDYVVLTQRAPFDYDALARFAHEVMPAFRS